MTPQERVLEALAKKIEENPDPKLVAAFKSLLDVTISPDAFIELKKRILNLESSLDNMSHFLEQNLSPQREISGG